MATFVYRPGHPLADCNGMVDRAVAGYDERTFVTGVISDIMDPLRHMATGEMFDSKSNFRAATRRAGCREIGDDRSAEPRERPRGFIKPKDDHRRRREDIQRAIYQLKNR